MSRMEDQSNDLNRLLKHADGLRDQVQRIEDTLVWSGRPLAPDLEADIKAAHERLQAALANYAARWGKR